MGMEKGGGSRLKLCVFPGTGSVLGPDFIFFALSTFSDCVRPASSSASLWPAYYGPVCVCCQYLGTACHLFSVFFMFVKLLLQFFYANHVFNVDAFAVFDVVGVLTCVLELCPAHAPFLCFAEVVGSRFMLTKKIFTCFWEVTIHCSSCTWWSACVCLCVCVSVCVFK